MKKNRQQKVFSSSQKTLRPKSSNETEDVKQEQENISEQKS